jgi:PhzF family phenazine biosynthesis protein
MGTNEKGDHMQVRKIAAFTHGDQGGNPAGVVLCDQMPAEAKMLTIAKEVGYSETAFLEPRHDGWRVRYFSPEIEVPFCGHATIASGAVLGERSGEGVYKLHLNSGKISVDVVRTADGRFEVSLRSPATWSQAAPPKYVDQILPLFSISPNQLDPNFPVRIAFAGAKHLILVLKERQTLADMHYEFKETKALMLQEDIGTISLLWPASDELFHARNAFASGGVVEDPATGAAAAALGGYLRDIGWPGSKRFEILQGEDMGCPSRLFVAYTPTPGESVRVSGQTRSITV